MTRKTKIILTGAQGTGKTTINNALEPILKEIFKDIEIIDSMSEKFFNKEDFKDLNSHRYIEAQQNIYNYAKSQYLSDQNFLSSRGFADSYAYLKHSLDMTNKQIFRDMIKENFENNKKLMRSGRIYTFYVPIEFDIEAKDLRSTSKKFQKEMDDNIKDFLVGTGTIFTEVTGTVKQRVRKILRELGLDPELYQG